MNRLAEPMSFDNESIEVPVTIKGKNYTLREASGFAAGRFVNIRSETFKLGPQGQIVGFKNVGNLPSLLVSMCLVDEHGKFVKQSEVEGWSNKIQEQLYNRALDISGLRERNESMASQLKNALDQEGSPITMEELSTFVMGLDPEEYKSLRNLVRPSVKDQAGNSLSDNADGSL